MEKTVGERIAELRARRGPVRGRGKFTQRDLAEAVGVSKSTIAAWEGDAQLPRGENLLRLARALDTTPDYILGGGREGAHPELVEPEPTEGETELERILANEQAFVRYLGGARLGGQAAPEERRRRMLDAMEGLRRLVTARGDPLPDWYYRVLGRIEAGDIDLSHRPSGKSSVEELDLLDGVAAVDRQTPPAADTPAPGMRRAAR